MVKISDLDEYLHADAITSGDVITVTGKARYVGAEESTFDRAYVEIPVKLPNGKTKVWTPNKTSLRAIAKVFGDDTDLWVGKRITIMISRQNVRGKMIDVLYGEPFVEATQPKQEQLVQ
jgi:hypothetical protein